MYRISVLEGHLKFVYYPSSPQLLRKSCGSVDWPPPLYLYPLPLAPPYQVPMPPATVPPATCPANTHPSSHLHPPSAWLPISPPEWLPPTFCPSCHLLLLVPTSPSSPTPVLPSPHQHLPPLVLAPLTTSPYLLLQCQLPPNHSPPWCLPPTYLKMLLWNYQNDLQRNLETLHSNPFIQDLFFPPNF